MKNNKGFTLTEVLLAAMIVGIIGIALAALTTAALRESGIGRSRLMLRNQLSLFLRQLRQDVRASDSLEVTNNDDAFQFQLKLTQKAEHKLGPDQQTTNTITYTCNTSSGNCTRNDGTNNETVLDYVQVGSGSDDWFRPFQTDNAANSSILTVRLIVGMDSNPPIKEAIEETIVLPQGFVPAEPEN